MFNANETEVSLCRTTTLGNGFLLLLLITVPRGDLRHIPLRILLIRGPQFEMNWLRNKNLEQSKTLARLIYALVLDFDL